MKKKIIALVLVVAMLLTALIGCSSKATTSSSGAAASSTPAASSTTASSSSASSSAASSAAADPTAANAGRDKVNIRFSQYANSTDDPEGMANDPIKKAIEDTVNVTLEYDTGTDGYDDRLATELAVGNAPDLFPTWGESDKISKWVDEGAVTNLGDIINGDPERYPILYKMINTKEYKAYNKMYLGDENACYAIYSISCLAYPMFDGVPVYNSALLKQYNDGKVPSTVDEFEDYTTKVAAAGYSGWWPYNVKLTNWGEMNATIASPMRTSILSPNGGTAWNGFVPDDDSKIGTDAEHWTLMTTSDKSKEAVKKLAEMYKSGAIDQDVGVADDVDDGYAQFAAGKLASYSYGFGYYTQFHKIYCDVWQEAHPDATLSDLTFGTALQNDGEWSHSYDTGTWVGANYFIPTSCTYPDRVLDLVEYLASKAGQMMIFRGLEGLTYTMDGDTVNYNMDAFVNINKSYGYANPDRCRYMWFSYLFAGGEMMVDLEDNDWWTAVTSPHDNTTEWATDADKEVYDYALDSLSKFVDNVYVKLPSYYAFVTLPGDLSDLRTQLDDITNRYLSAFLGGQMDVETGWAQYQAEYEAAGASKLEDALNQSISDCRTTYGS